MSDYLTEGVLLEIFLRLPSKSVLEMRYVCKSWYSIVTDPQFVSRYNHLAVNRNNNNELFIRRFDRSCAKDIFTLHHNDNGLFAPYHEMNLPLDTRHRPYSFIGACLGLMCFHGYFFRKLPRQIIIWNPSLGFSKKVKVEPLPERVEEPIFGFGFDPKRNHFKVVKIAFYMHKYRAIGTRDVHAVEVYNLSLKKWKNITVKKKAKPPCYMKENSWKVFLNNGIHWIGNCDGQHRLIDHRRLILAVFDMSDEVFKLMDMPDEVINEQTASLETKEKLRVDAVNGLLGLFHYFIQWDKSPSFDGCHIWVMNEYGVEESWTKLYRVDLRLGIGKLVGVRKNGEILLVTRHNSELVSFHTVTRKINRLDMYAELKSFYTGTYIESLAMYKRSAKVAFNSRDHVSSSSNASATAKLVELPANEKGKKANGKLKRRNKHRN